MQDYQREFSLLGEIANKVFIFFKCIVFPTSSYYCKVLAYPWVLDPLHFVSYIQWLINPLCLCLPRPYTLSFSN